MGFSTTAGAICTLAPRSQCKLPYAAIVADPVQRAEQAAQAPARTDWHHYPHEPEDFLAIV